MWFSSLVDLGEGLPIVYSPPSKLYILYTFGMQKKYKTPPRIAVRTVFLDNFPQDCIRSQNPNAKCHTSKLCGGFLVIHGMFRGEFPGNLPPKKIGDTPSFPHILLPQSGILVLDVHMALAVTIPKVSWVVSPTNGDDLQPTYI